MSLCNGRASKCMRLVAKTENRASHPVWGFKNIKAGGVGVGTLVLGVPPASDKA